MHKVRIRSIRWPVTVRPGTEQARLNRLYALQSKRELTRWTTRLVVKDSQIAAARILPFFRSVSGAADTIHP